MQAARSPATGSPRRYADGTTITRQGDAVSLPALIESGLVRLSAVSDDGREVVLALAGPGEVLDDCALRGEPSPVTATALTETRLRRQASAASELEMALARRLGTAIDLLAEAMLHDVRTRLMHRLQDLAVRRHSGVRLPLSQEELGRMIGASRETVNRALRDLARRGDIGAGSR